MPEQIEVERGELVIISAPHWFEREDFLRWLRNDEGSVATWDRGVITDPPTEYSDCFITFDGGPLRSKEELEGSHFNASGEGALPEDIEDEIKSAVCANARSGYGVVWIKPV